MRARMTETRSFSNRGRKLIPVNGCSPGRAPASADAGPEGPAARGASFGSTMRRSLPPSCPPARSPDQYASPAFVLWPSSRGTTTAAGWEVSAPAPFTLRTRTRALSSTGRWLSASAAQAGRADVAAASAATRHAALARNLGIPPPGIRRPHVIPGGRAARGARTTMEYRRLGTTGLKISRLGLGCGNFGGMGSAPAFYGMGDSEQEAFALMDRAWDAGINFFDTADAYGGGRSEALIGRWLTQTRANVRARLRLTSKVFTPVGPGPNDRGLSRRHILRQVEASLVRLQTDRLDMYLIHEPDPDTRLEETVRALDDLVHAGKVLYVGASNIEAWRLARGPRISDKESRHRFEWVQNSYSLLDRAAEHEVFPLCTDQGLGFTAFSPLAGGWLTGKYDREGPYPPGSRMTLRPEPYLHLLTETTFAGLRHLEKAARERGTAMSTLALAWVLHHPQMTAAIVGPRRPEHLDSFLSAIDLPLTDDEARGLARSFEA